MVYDWRSGGFCLVVTVLRGFRLCLWTWCTHPARHPAVVFHVELCMFSGIAFLHFLRVPRSTGQSGIIQGIDNLAFVGCHQSRMWNPIALSSESSGLRDV